MFDPTELPSIADGDSVDPRVLLLAATSIPFASVFAHERAHDAARAASPVPAAQAAMAASGPKEQAARLFFSDRRLTTQRGREVAFYSDVLKDKVVLINFVFTHCTDSCPTQSARVAEVQSLLDATAARDVELVSISVDPERDTPAALAEYAARFHAGRNWTFLTGRKEDVDDVLRRLGQLTEEARSHTTLFIAGNAATGHWMKLHPDAPPAAIAARLRALTAERPANGVTTAR
jgi:cytochrome oxidase Cu insertion factor (SCO1/SenC/PrrC family)